MGSISKRPDGSYRAYARVDNKRKSKVFGRKGDARAWLEATEKKLGSDAGKSLFDAFDRYESSYSSQKKGARWESVRLGLFRRQFKDVPLLDVSRSTIAEWRDARLQEVSGSTVRREFNLLSAVFAAALYEWEWITENPCKGVKRPPAAQPRDRVFTPKEIRIIAKALPPVAGNAFLFAIETGMRAGEITAIEKKHRRGRILTIPDSKTGASRKVPLSKKAQDILDEVGGEFQITSGSLSTLFLRTMKKLDVPHGTFHDTRHTAITRLSKKLDPLELARVVGHKNVNQLLAYYNPSTESLADKLD